MPEKLDSCVNQVKDQGHSESSAYAICVDSTGLSPKQKSETMSVNTQDMIDEHKDLINILESPSHKDDQEEAKKQKKELKEYKEKLSKNDDIVFDENSLKLPEPDLKKDEGAMSSSSSVPSAGGGPEIGAESSDIQLPSSQANNPEEINKSGWPMVANTYVRGNNPVDLNTQMVAKESTKDSSSILNILQRICQDLEINGNPVEKLIQGVDNDIQISLYKKEPNLYSGVARDINGQIIQEFDNQTLEIICQILEIKIGKVSTDTAPIEEPKSEEVSSREIRVTKDGDIIFTLLKAKKEDKMAKQKKDGIEENQKKLNPAMNESQDEEMNQDLEQDQDMDQDSDQEMDEDMDSEKNKDPNDVLTEVDEEHPEGIKQPMGQVSEEEKMGEDMESPDNLEYIKMSTHDGGKQYWYKDKNTGKIVEKDNAPEGHPDFDQGNSLAELAEKVDMLLDKISQLTGEDLSSEMSDQNSDQEMDQKMDQEMDEDMDSEDMDEDSEDMEEDSDQDMVEDEQSEMNQPQHEALNATKKKEKTSQKPAPKSVQDEQQPKMNKKQKKDKVMKSLQDKYPTLSKTQLEVAVEKALLKSENPDLAADASLGEKIERLVEEHMRQNAKAEKEEGHPSVMDKGVVLTGHGTETGSTEGYDNAIIVDDKTKKMNQVKKADSDDSDDEDKQGEMKNASSNWKEALSVLMKTLPEELDSQEDVQKAKSKLQDLEILAKSHGAKDPRTLAITIVKKSRGEDYLNRLTSSNKIKKSRFDRMWKVFKIGMPDTLKSQVEVEQAKEGLKKLQKCILNQGKSIEEANRIANRALIEKYDLLNKGMGNFKNYAEWMGGNTINDGREVANPHEMEALRKSDAEARFNLRDYMGEIEPLILEKSSNINQEISSIINPEPPKWEDYKTYQEPVVKSNPSEFQKSQIKFQDERWNIPAWNEGSDEMKIENQSSNINERIAKSQEKNNVSFEGQYNNFDEAKTKLQKSRKTETEILNEQVEKNNWSVKPHKE
jgi:hypothetical protein